MLGSSETIGRHADLFRLVDKKHKFYAKKSHTGPIAFEFTETGMYKSNQMSIQKLPVLKDSNWTNLDIQHEADRIVLKKFAPCGVVINEDMEVLQFRGHTGEFLEPAAGDASLNLLKMVRDGLQMELRNAIHQCVEKKRCVRKEGLRLKGNGDISFVTIEVDPFSDIDKNNYFLLVSFYETDKADKKDNVKKKDSNVDETSRETDEIQRIEQELIATREYLHSVIEQQEVTNEELTSANEEIQASNEELQSTNEELETAKEELQSSNEELYSK